MTRAIFLAACVSLGLAPGGAVQADPAERDLAILLPSDGRSRVRATPELFPASWYDTVLAAFAGTAVGDALELENRFEDWQLVSLRIAPCAPLEKHPGAASERCWPEVRLVWQPIVPVVEVGGRRMRNYADDRAIHALYDVSPRLVLGASEAPRAERYLEALRTGRQLSAADQREFLALRDTAVRALLAETLALRGAGLADTAFRGLGLRPEALDGSREAAFIAALRRFVARQAAPHNLRQLTAFSLPEGRQPALLDEWVFLAFRGVSGTLQPAPIRIHAADDGRALVDMGASMRASMGRDDTRLYELPEPLLSTVNASVGLFRSDFARLAPLVRDRRALLVDNTSCATCHKMNPLRFDFHNLSYLEDQPMTISPRVVTDVMLDLAWLRETTLR